ncbi:MAG: polyamine aminopropyltransferase [Calditrichia bacterium]
MAIYFSEYYPEAKAALQMEVSRTLFRGQSPFQKIDVVETPGFGRVLLIDDLVMLTEKDEFVYHEMIAHVPLHVHPHPGRVLVIGGGDGGTVREILKHPRVEHVDLVDIDQMVTEVCLEYIPSVASHLKSERVTCRFEDGVAFVKNATEKYDVILVDSTDPISVGEGLFTPEFYRNCFNLLTEQGILVNQAETPFYAPKWVGDIKRKLSDIFPILNFYQAHIPTYPSGHWLFGFASKSLHPVKDFIPDHVDPKLEAELKYYNREIHKAAFALPNFVRRLID